MIFELVFPHKKEYAQAENVLKLLQQYDKEFDGFQEIEEVILISEEAAKTIMLKNCDYDEEDPDDHPEFSLYDTAVGTDFVVIGSTEWD